MSHLAAHLRMRLGKYRTSIDEDTRCASCPLRSPAPILLVPSPTSCTVPQEAPRFPGNRTINDPLSSSKQKAAARLLRIEKGILAAALEKVGAMGVPLDSADSSSSVTRPVIS